MSYELTQEFFIDAAHTLDRTVEADASRRVHGHTYHVAVTIRGEPDAATGMVLDLGDFRREMERVRAELDHRILDDVEGMGAATLENLCAFIARFVRPALPGLHAVEVSRRASGDRCRLSL
jgi:6-pyruvoyltetrahydropterin/6-carboxytetrahydropterin synthase